MNVEGCVEEQVWKEWQYGMCEGMCIPSSWWFVSVRLYHWTGLVVVDWTSGLDRWTGPVDWTSGLDW